MNVIVAGSLGYDYIMDFPGRFADRIMPDKIHGISLSFLVDKLNKQFGGTAGNIAYTLRFLDINPHIVAPAGSDFGPYRDFLLDKGISVDSVVVHKNIPTSAYFVITDKEDNQIGSFYIGATKYAKDLSVAGRRTGNFTDFVVLAPTDPQAMKKYVKECRDSSLLYLYDPAFQIATFTADELKDGIEGASILIGNDYEIALIEEKLGISHEELRSMVPVLVTTLGSRGSIIETRKSSVHIRPARASNVIDPTGAGDAYRAGFVAGFMRLSKQQRLKLSPEDLIACGRMGSVAAAYTVEKYGTVTHTFTLEEFKKRYRENYGEELNLS